MCLACTPTLARVGGLMMGRVARHGGVLLAPAGEAGTAPEPTGGGDGAAGADTILRRGQILTIDPAQRQVEAIAIRDGRIVALGSDELVMGLRTAGTRVVDLDGRTVMPGFVDPHLHVLLMTLAEHVLLDASPLKYSTQAEIIEMLRAALAENPGQAVGAGGYDPSRMPPDHSGLTADDLDAVSLDIPVVVFNASGHIGYANHAALRAADIDDDTPKPEGGTFVHDSEGRLTGEFWELGAVLRLLPLLAMPAPDEFMGAIGRTLHDIAGAGVTTIMDAGVGFVGGPLDAHVLRTIVDLGQPVRMAAAISHADDIPAQLAMQPGEGDDRLRFNAIKFIADGSLQGFTGAVSDPYLGARGTGALNYADDELRDQMRVFHQAGWQIMVHANGDRAVAQAIDAYDAVLSDAPRANHRHRIEHATVVTREHMAAAANLELEFSHLIGHVHYWGTAMRDHVLGDRAHTIDPLAWGLEHGMRPSLHSDAPVSPVRPLTSLQTAATRLTIDGEVLGADQCVAVDDALEMMTINAARHASLESEVGTLEVGKRADLVFLDDNPRETDPTALASLSVLETWKDGEQVALA